MENQNTDQVLANTNLTPIAPPSNSIKPARKLFLKVIIGSIIFLLIAGGAAASFTVFRPQIMKLVSKPTLTPTPKIAQTSPTPTPDPTAKWKTYSDSRLEFSIKYPPNIDPILETHDSLILRFREVLPQDAPDGYEQSPGFTINISLKSIESGNFQKDFDDYINKYKLNGTITKEPAKISLGKYSGYSFKGTAEIEQTFLLISDENEMRLIMIVYSVFDPNNKGYQQLIDQILSTFKFTN